MSDGIQTTSAGDAAATDAGEILRLREQLIAMERLSAVGELTGTVTHEFNNVLMTILNYANLGLRQKDPAARDKAFQKIYDAATRASTICNTVLSVAKTGDGSGECDVSATVKDSLVLLERELQKYRIYVELQLSPVPPASIAAPQLQRVLINLITNARQAIGQTGTISLKTSFDSAEDRVVLAIKDSGPGIPADVLPKIFERFFTTKAGPDGTGKGGTGLGLAMCREIVEQAGGRIRVETAPGKGTAFILRLPTARPAAKDLPEPKATRRRAPARTLDAAKTPRSRSA